MLCLAAAEEASKPAAVRELNGFRITRPAVPPEKIISGGPPRDGIRSVDKPRFATLDRVTWAGPDTPVIGLFHAGQARAYPVHLLEYHQVVNDEIGGIPVVVTYDPLTGCPRAFRRRVKDRTLEFGVSGLLYNSGFLLYDRQTESLWSQFLGRGLSGEFSGQGLDALRVRQETLATWLERHPDSKVLERPDPKRIDYRYSPFEVYWVKDEIPYPVEAEDRRFHAKEVVVGVTAGGRSRAYLGSRVTAAGGVVEDRFHDRRLLIEYSPETSLFRWDIPEEIAVTEAYWFAWKAFHPKTEIWSPPAPDASTDEAPR